MVDEGVAKLGRAFLAMRFRSRTRSELHPGSIGIMWLRAFRWRHRRWLPASHHLHEAVRSYLWPYHPAHRSQQYHNGTVQQIL